MLFFWKAVSVQRQLWPVQKLESSLAPGWLSAGSFAFRKVPHNTMGQKGKQHGADFHWRDAWVAFSTWIIAAHISHAWTNEVQKSLLPVLYPQHTGNLVLEKTGLRSTVDYNTNYYMKKVKITNNWCFQPLLSFKKLVLEGRLVPDSAKWPIETEIKKTLFHQTPVQTTCK